MNDLNIEVKYINYESNPWGCIQTYGYDDICRHNTGSDASADDEWAYMNRMQPNGHPTVHYFVDDIKAIKCMPLSIDAWAVSDGTGKGGNTTDIHIEVCYSKSGGSKYEKAVENANKLIAILCNDLGWKPDDRIKFHYDYGTKYCPHRELDGFNGDKEKLRNHIIDEVNALLNENKIKPEEIEEMEITWEKENRARALVGTIDNAKFSGDKIAKFTKTTNIYTDITCDTRNASKSYFEAGDIVVGYSVGWQTRKTGARVLVYKFINSIGAIYYTIVDEE